MRRIELNANSLAQFVDPLPLPEIAAPSGHRADPDNPALRAVVAAGRKGTILPAGS